MNTSQTPVTNARQVLGDLPPCTSSKFVSCANTLEYPRGTKRMPWWTSVDNALETVVSCPPPTPALDTNIEAYLPASAPEAHSWPVASQNA